VADNYVGVQVKIINKQTIWLTIEALKSSNWKKILKH
jgi:hypothetical protein